MKPHNKICKKIIVCLAFLVCAGVMASCDSWIYDDLADCKMYFQFRYDYNMLKTDAFASQVNEVTIFVFDEKGHFIKTQSEKGEALKQNKYLMETSLKPGQKYTVLTWAGHLDSYMLSELTENVSSPADLIVRLKNYDTATMVCDKEIDELWYGRTLQFERVAGSQTETIDLIRNTNHIRLIITNQDDEAATAQQSYSIRLTADNSAYNYKYECVSTVPIIYKPFYQEKLDANNFVAEMATMRLIAGKPYALVVNDNSGHSIFGDNIPSISLEKYLLMTKMESDAMGEQEYLDREYNWKIIIFCHNVNVEGTLHYFATRIDINDWTVWKQEENL